MYPGDGVSAMKESSSGFTRDTVSQAALIRQDYPTQRNTFRRRVELEYVVCEVAVHIYAYRSKLDSGMAALHKASPNGGCTCHL